MQWRKSPGLFAGAVLVLASIGLAAADAHAEPLTVYFASADGRTELVGYLFAPPPTKGPHPSVVMLHGRAGPYSGNVNKDCTLVAKEQVSPCNASSLSRSR